MFDAEFWAKLLTFYIPVKSVRRKIKTEIRNHLYAHKLMKNAKFLGKGFVCYGRSIGNHNTYIGENVCINGIQIIGEGICKIGAFTQFGHQVLIITSNHDYDNGEKIPYDSNNICKEVEIGDFAWIGSRVTILPGTKIGEGAIIQAGAVVHGEIPRGAIAGGNPATVFKYRNLEHFDTLKANKEFFVIGDHIKSYTKK